MIFVYGFDIIMNNKFCFVVFLKMVFFFFNISMKIGYKIPKI
ncbi:hypothetical protein SAMN02746065_106160 [Desulfocicer vacuolatum DSM 3385]|uniref:Uncharacterized protein n=1 Tax=Desulfocicer vacuolatum DSM 3385 TaxID=1121400 RepID=A0A1W2AYM3_9BACT|nr:hypothetical protein SAMN02746065_106160 [Desulfocicer vacuolatum DSM 3385]